MILSVYLAAPNSPGSASTTTAGHLSPTNAQNSTSVTTRPQISGGRFDFEDGGTYCGGWDEGMRCHFAYLMAIFVVVDDFLITGY